MHGSNDKVEELPFRFEELKGDGKPFDIDAMINLFAPVSRTRDSRLLELLDIEEAIVCRYEPESCLYSVALGNRRSYSTYSCLENSRLLQQIATALHGRGNFRVQRNEHDQTMARRRVQRDSRGVPKTEFSPKLGKKHRVYDTMPVGLYEIYLF